MSMCGRYAFNPDSNFYSRYKTKNKLPSLESFDSCRPIDFLPTIYHDNGLVIDVMRRGLNSLMGDYLPTFTIITIEANVIIKPVHDRMPVILSRSLGWICITWILPQVFGFHFELAKR